MRKLREYGWEVHGVEPNISFNCPDIKKSLDELNSNKQIEKYFNKFYRKFYWRPQYIVRRFIKDILSGTLFSDVVSLLKTKW